MKRPTNKRSQELKSILQADQPNPLLDITEEIANVGTNVQAPTGNVRAVTFGEAKASAPSVTSGLLTQSIELFHQLLDKELAKSASVLGIDELELKAWVDLQIEVPAKTILALLRSMQSLHLDPLCEEIGFVQYEDGQWQVLITIEGCAKLLNQNNQFNGLTFTQSETLIDGVPEWIECAIYRRDRALPITVREHLVEVRAENAIWQKMPRRMLRHRALQQCVRLAMG